MKTSTSALGLPDCAEEANASTRPEVTGASVRQVTNWLPTADPAKV
jgi:hypothetical protein